MTLDWVYRTTVPRFRAVGSAAVCLIVGAVALVPLVPAWPYPAAAATVPQWFTSNALGTADGYHGGGLPELQPQRLLRHAVAGDVEHDLPHAGRVRRVRQLAWQQGIVLCRALRAPDRHDGRVIGAPPEITPEKTRSTLHDWKASYVVVVPGTAGAACATNLFDEALGAHRTVGGVSVWSTGVAG